MPHSSVLVDVLSRVKDSVVALDNNYVITYANSAYARIFGLEPPQMIGKNIWALLPKAAGTIIHKNINEAIEKNELRRFEWDGIYAKSFWETTIFPSDKGVTIITKDISENKKARQALEISMKRFQVLSETTTQLLSSDDPQAIVESLCTTIMNHLKCECFFNFLTDKSKGKLRLNAYAGIPKEEAEKIRLIDFGAAICGCVAQSGKRMLVWDIQNSVDERISLVKSYGFQAYACHPLIAQRKLIGTLAFGTKNRISFDEEELELMRTVADQVSVAIQRINDEQELRKYAANMETLAKQRAEQLKDTERLAAIGATAGMVGHDIRNPLQAIVSDVYLLKDDLALMPDCYQAKANAAESLESIESNIAYINKIVADLQDFARPLTPECTFVDLPELIGDILETINIPDNIEVSADNVDRTPVLRTDPVFVRRALSNLLNNAIQAMPNGGHLKLESYSKEGKIYITVSDTGVGIPEDVKPKLFTPMMTTKSKGQGLGLAVVKRLIESLNGSVTFESQEGKGTKFTLILPRQS